MYSVDSRVRYSEVNSEKELTLPSLLDYLQDCCTFQSEDLGIGVDYLTEHHVAWVLSSWQIQIEKYPQMAEHIRVSTWPYCVKGFYGFRNFLIQDMEGNVLARANSVWVFMDTENMHPVRLTTKVQDVYAARMEAQLEGEWGDRKIKLSKEDETHHWEKEEAVKVARFHIDTNHHVNNGKYILIAEEYLPVGFEVTALRVEYKKAAVLGDILYPAVTAGEHCVTVVLADENEKPYAVVQFMGKKE